jgi:hypothetical protein
LGLNSFIFPRGQYFLQKKIKDVRDTFMNAPRNIQITRDLKITKKSKCVRILKKFT